MMTPGQAIENIAFGDLTVDLNGRRVLRDGQRLPMGPQEFKLLETLILNRGRVLTGDELRILVWSDDPSKNTVPAGDVNALYVSIRKLRAALRDHGKYVVNIPKVGYTISESAVTESQEAESPGIPGDVSPIVGREAEVEAVCSALKTGRTVTITGPPGIGKTRLAQEAARLLRNEFRDGAHFIDLKAIDDTRFVVKSVMSALNLPESPGQEIEQEVIAALSGRSTLLVLDNCEHVVEAVAGLVGSIGRAAPHVRVLSTSREPLHLSAETVVPIGPLDVPSESADLGVDELLAFPSVMLFIKRAEQRRPDLTLLPADILKIGELCRRLEGIPIAIELAAAQVDAYPIEQILAAMSDRFRLLRRRGEDSRYETLEGAIDWSYGLLSDEERAVLRRVSVLIGGMTVQSAHAVCGNDAQTQADTVHILAGLVRRSLIQLSLSKQRYEMLDMIRQFARDRLEESRETADALDRRTRYFVDLAERSYEDGDRGEWPAILRAEYDNIRAVLRRTVIEGIDPISGLRLCGALNRFWFYNGYFNEALQWTDLALTRDDGSDLAARGRALTSAGFFFGQMPGAKDDATKRRSYFEESIGIWRGLGDRKNLGVTLIGYSYLLNRMGEYDDAIATAREALETFRQTDFHFQTARAANNLALDYLDIGEFDLAKPLLEEALADARLSDDTFLEAICLHNLGELAIQTDDLGSAQEHLDKCLAMFEDLEQRPMVARTMLLRGEMLARSGDLVPAISTQQDALKELDEMQDNQSIASGLETIGCTLAHHQKELPIAAELISAASSLRDQLDIRLGPARKSDIETVLRRIRDEIGESAFSTAVERGRKMPTSKAIHAAMAV